MQIQMALRSRPGGPLTCHGVTDHVITGRAQTLEPLLSIEEAAAVLAISQRGVYRLIEREHLLALKVGGCTRIEQEELRRFIAEHRKRPLKEANDG